MILHCIDTTHAYVLTSCDGLQYKSLPAHQNDAWIDPLNTAGTTYTFQYYLSYIERLQNKWQAVIEGEGVRDFISRHGLGMNSTVAFYKSQDQRIVSLILTFSHFLVTLISLSMRPIIVHF